MPDPHRALVVLLEEYGPLCEQCLAFHARMTISDLTETLTILRRSIAFHVEQGECPRCQQFTQMLALGEDRGGSCERYRS